MYKLQCNYGSYRKMTIISFSYKNRSYIVTCTSIIDVCSSLIESDLLVYVNYIDGDGSILPFFGLRYINSVIVNKKSIKLLVLDLCEHIENKYK